MQKIGIKQQGSSFQCDADISSISPDWREWRDFRRHVFYIRGGGAMQIGTTVSLKTNLANKIKTTVKESQSKNILIFLLECSVKCSFSTHIDHVSISPTDGIEPTQGQRKTLTRVSIEPTTFGLDHCCSSD